MKVAMVTPYWFPVRGGVTTFVSELSATLRQMGHEVRVFARQGSAAGATELGGTGREFVPRAAEALAAFRPDVVHAHGHWYTLAAGLRHRKSHPACRVVFTLHTPFPRRSWWRRYAFRLLMSRADFVTGVSAELLSRTLQTFGPRVRTRVTRAGVAVRATSEEETAAFRRLFHLDGRGPLIGYLGRLAWEGKVRGVEQLIRAMRLVHERVPSATLMIGGDGPHRERLEALAAKEVPDAVVFLGDVPDPAPRFFTAAQVYAHISDQEGLPLSLLEAMACNSAVVASAVGGIPEVIRDGVNGFLVSNEPEDVAARIVQILEDPELQRRLMRNARRDVDLQFAWPRAAGRFLATYGERTVKQVVVTVDLEKDYRAVDRPFRGVEEAMPKLLDLFDRHGIRATVFATADLAGTHGETLKEVVRRGHALGCHGESHDVPYLCDRPYAWQRASIARATEALSGLTGEPPAGFRAPNFSVDGNTIRTLDELGYRYDSSVLPGRVVRRLSTRLDFFVAPRDPYHPGTDDPALAGHADLWELPVTENPFAPGGPIGLGYVNAFGVEKALDAVARAAAYPVVFLIHPWELVEPPPGRIPDWMGTGCTSDPMKLDAFLGRLRADHEVTTFDAVLG
jgi:glycosyltransferase involved in cell wall biosynthesis